MPARAAVLLVVLVFIVGFGFLTANEIATDGFNALSALSLLVLALFAFGVVGALWRPPSE